MNLFVGRQIFFFLRLTKHLNLPYSVEQQNSKMKTSQFSLIVQKPLEILIKTKKSIAN